MFLSLYFPHFGGVENYIRYINNELVKDGFQITINTTNSLGYKKGNSLKKIEAFSGTIIRRFPSISPSLTRVMQKEQNIPLSPALALSALTSGADINHIHIPHQVIGEANALVSSLSKIPTLLTVHNFEVYKSRLELSAFELLTPFTNKMFDRVDGIIVKSELLKLRYFSNRFSKKIHIIRDGIDINRFNLTNRDRVRKEQSISEIKTILFVSVLDIAHQYKGLYWLLKAVKELLENHENIQLNVVGSGDLKERYEKMVNRWGLDGRVKFLGRVSDEELCRQYYLADLFVLPSISELERVWSRST